MPGTRSRCRRRAVLTAAMALLAVLLVGAGPAWAHASFVSATPRPGSGLPQAPGEVVLRFSEPLIRDASSVTIRDDAGEEVVDGPTRAVEGDPRAMRRSIGLLAPGVYTVDWTTVSPLDGHTLKGSYRFAVGMSTAGGAVVSEDPLTSEGPAGLLGTWLALGGLAVWIGGALLGRRAREAGVAPVRLARARRAALLATVAGTTVAVLSMATGTAVGLEAVVSVVLDGPSGRWSVAVIAFAIVGFTLRGRAARQLDPVLALVAVFAEAASGHAGSNPTPWVAATTFAVHLVVVGVWVYAVVAALLADGDRLSVLRRFTCPAVVAAAMVGLTGVASAWLELTSLGDLVGTAYGQTVLAKGAAFTAMALVGLEHWRRRRRGVAEASVSWLVRVEALVAVAALAVATLLVGFPNPPREAAAATAANDPVSVLQATLAQPSVSVGGRSGPYVVGVTVTPPRPGPVDVVVQVEGVEPGDALRDVRVAATGPTDTTGKLTECGVGCYRGAMELSGEGAWALRVHGTTNAEPLDATVVLDLPAADGSARFDDVLTAMADLESARVREELRSEANANPIVSSYRFSAPDRMRWDVTPATADGRESTRIAIGDTGYLTDASEADGWKTYDWIGEPFSWPVGFYEEFFVDATAIREVGAETLDGTPTTVLAFTQTAYPAWYRLWVDDEDRIRRLEMLADGHFMDQYFQDLNEPVDVRPPTAADSAAS